MTGTMKRWEMSAPGRDNLTLRGVAIPEPKAGEVPVKVGAVALNYRDLLVINGTMSKPQWPFTPASDMAGTVVSAGDGAARFKAGDRVISTFAPGWIEGRPLGDAHTPPYRALGGFYPGVLAEYVAFPEDWFVAAPSSLDDAAASTLPCAGLTAWFALIDLGHLRAGETVLVQGTGGVALFGAQIARAHGAEIIVTSGSDEKLARAQALGLVDHGINRTTADWVEVIYRVTGNRGVDHILEIVGGGHLSRSLQAVAVHGRISVIGVLEGFEVSGPAGPLLLKGAVIQGISVGHRRALEDFVRAIDRLKLQPVIDARYGFDDLPAALSHLERGPFGKVVLSLG